MSNNSSSTWWEKYREAVNVTKHYHLLITLVNNRKDIAQNMIDREKEKHPGKNESWYLTKIIKELKQDCLVDLMS